MMRFKFPIMMRVILTLCLSQPLWLVPVAAQQPAPEEQDEVVRISTELVQTDVTVLDKQGNFVDGLGREQFELRVDGKPQAISFFERAEVGTAGEETLLRAMRGGDRSGAPRSGAATTARRGRRIFFFMDDLHLSSQSVVRARETLQRFVDSAMGPNDQVAIVTASGQLGFLQQLTSDKAVLRAAIKRLTYRPYDVGDNGRPPMSEYQALAIVRNDRDAFDYFAQEHLKELCQAAEIRNCEMASGMTNNQVLEDAPRGSRTGNTSGTGTSTGTGTGAAAAGNRAAILASLRTQAASMVRTRARNIVRQSAALNTSMLASLESLIRTAAPLPGRKLVVFLSDGFFINHVTSSNAYDLRRITDAAVRSGAVLYTIDTRGLTSGLPDASKDAGFDATGRMARVGAGEATESQEAFHTLAADTGGRAWLNSNALDTGIVQAIKETSAYYVLAWRPEAGVPRDGKFRQIEVSVKGRPDLTVRVQRGFFDAAAETASKPGDKPGQAKSPDDELLSVLRAPHPRRALPTSLSLGYMNRPAEGTVLAASMEIDGQALEFAAGGAQNVEVDVMGAVADDKGTVVSDFKQRLTVTPAERQRIVYTSQSRVAPGLYQVRVAARDRQSGRMGSAMQWIEIPDTVKGDFALSSIFLSELTAGGGAASSPGSALNPDHRFARTSQLRFQTYAYNAAHTASAPPDVALQVRLSRDGQTVVETPPSPISTAGVTDPARIPVAAEFPLGGFPPGQYALQITVTDRAGKKSASQQVSFTIE